MFSFDFSLFVTIIWSIIAVYVTIFVFSQVIFLYRVTRLPTYKPLSIVYSILLSIGRGDPDVFRKLIADHEHYFQEHGYCVIWVLFYPFLLIGRYDRAQEIVAKPTIIDKGLLISLSEVFFGQGLIASKNVKWKIRQRLVWQQLSSLSISYYVNSISSLSMAVTKSIDQLIGKNDFKQMDIMGFFALPTIKMIVGKAAGVELMEADYEFLSEAMERFLRELDKRTIIPPFYLDFVYNIYLRLSGVQKMVDKMNGILLKAIRSKYNEIKDDLVIKNNENKRVNSLCEFLLRNWVKPVNDSTVNSLTNGIEQAILEEMKAIIIAGSDGMERQMTWFIYLLGCYHEYQDKIFEEVKDADVEDWTMATVNSFTFLEQSYKESMRLYTAVPIGLRKTEKDQMVDDKLLPKGLPIVISFVSILRDSKIFPQSFEFKPERFDTDAVPKIPSGAYIPYGLRPRDCVGQRLGSIYIKFIVGSIIKSFKFKSHRHWKDIDYSVVFTFKPVEPLNVTFERRK